MAFFHSFTESLKQKWLQFFHINRDWLNMHMEVESVPTPDGGKRPPSYLILGVVNALEPKLAQLMPPFSKLNPDADTLIDVLGLHFDPDIVLGNRVLSKENVTQWDSAVIVEEPDRDETLTISLDGDEMEHDLEMLEHREQIMVAEVITREELIATSLDELDEINWSQETHNGNGKDKQSKDEFQQTSHVNIVDEFGEISFDDLKEDDSKMSSTTPHHENEHRDALLDVWSEDTLPHKGETHHEIFKGEEELPRSAFDDTEIARLFPNT
ncbi:MAG: DUF5331 domain-containing protein [Rhizonema sp. PD38]|nr:DUF5331 domain-containing protein [Rhizonema sp. PD38]